MNKKKLEVRSVLSSNFKGAEKNYILKENILDFKILGTYIPKLLEYLWENPKLVSEIIINCDIKDIKESLANLFMNNFYENILSGNHIENNLMYVLTLLIKDEINNLEDINDFEKFMDDNSKVGYFMDELKKKNDIKYYFKISILNLISDLESMSSVSFSLNVQEIINNILLHKVSQEQNINESDIIVFDQMKSLFINDKKELEKLVMKYLSNLTVTDIKNMNSQSHNDNPIMNDYLNNIINNAKDEHIYSNVKLLEKFQLKKDSYDKLIFIYIHKINLIKDFIDKFLSFLKNNLISLPYSVKCICKIINILIQKKFPDINFAQKNAFISQFFFKKIIMPILGNPGIELLINNFIISGFTIPNLNIINVILNKLFSGKLFKYTDSNYTPFNWYILEKIPEIIEIFSKVTDIELPSFIEDLVNDRLDKNFIYDYSQLNKDEIIMHYSVCFGFHDLKSILDGLNKVKSQIDITQYKDGLFLLKTFEILNSEKNRKTLNLLENKNNNKSYYVARKGERQKKKIFGSMVDKGKDLKREIGKEIIEIETENFYLIQDIKINSEHKELFNIKYYSKNNFNIKE